MKVPVNFEKPPFFHSGSIQHLQGRSGVETGQTVNVNGLPQIAGVKSPMSEGFSSDYRVTKIETEPILEEEEKVTTSKRIKLVAGGQLSQMVPTGKSRTSSLVGQGPMMPVQQREVHQRYSGNGPMPTMGQSSVQASHFNPLSEPSPLGLSLRKSPSLLDLIQRKLAHTEEMVPQCSDDMAQDSKSNRTGSCITSIGADKDKLKAANFPASTLKIGTWERASRYDGDLVAKCYYAKRKLVWEVLDSGLKSKMEIQWSDISALKANFPEDQPASLDIEISRPPLFFREINPQPRKHTLWQSTSDFTEGQATICRHHSVQFPEGVLNRHFEKLVQCDARLKALSEQTCTITDSLFFDPRSMPLDKQQLLHYQSVFSDHTTLHSLAIEGLRNEPLPHAGPVHSVVESIGGHLSDVAPALGNLGPERRLEMQICDVASPSSVMDARGMDESSSSSETEEMQSKEDTPGEASDEQMYSRVAATDSNLKPLGGDVSRTIPTFMAGSLRQMSPYSGEWLSPPPADNLTKWKSDISIQASDKQMLNEIALHLLGEPVISTEKHVYTMGQVNAMSSVCTQGVHQIFTAMGPPLQAPSTACSFLDGYRDLAQCHERQVGSCHSGHSSVEDSKGHPRSGDNHWNSVLESRITSSFEPGTMALSSHGSCGDLVYLPRIASLPQFFEPAPVEDHHR